MLSTLSRCFSVIISNKSPSRSRSMMWMLISRRSLMMMDTSLLSWTGHGRSGEGGKKLLNFVINTLGKPLLIKPSIKVKFSDKVDTPHPSL